MTAVRRIAIALGAVVLVVILALAMVYRDPLRSLVSIRRVDDYPLFVMRLYGDGGVEDPRAVQGVAAVSTTPAVEAEWACTCFSAENSAGGRLFGRNFDWHNRPVLVLFAEPRDGYASMANSDISYLLPGSGRYVGEDADALRLADRIRLLDAGLIPFDGMNERGLVVGMMAVPTVPVLHHPGGPVLGSLQAIRLMLDRAATVEEALALLEGCSQESTRWSTVYDQTGGEVLIAVGRDYQNVHRFRLDMAVEGMGRAN